MKTVEVDYQKLVKLIVKGCPQHFYNSVHGESCHRKVKAGFCDLHVFSDELECPLDCPRISNQDFGCDKGHCPYIRNVIKSLKPEKC